MDRIKPGRGKTSTFGLCLSKVFGEMGLPSDYDFLMGMSGMAFMISACEEMPCPAGWVEAVPDIYLSFLSGILGRELMFLNCPRIDPGIERTRFYEGGAVGSVEDCLNESGRCIARGCWPAVPETYWGIVDGLDETNGLPIGRVPGSKNRALAVRPPYQVVLTGGPADIADYPENLITALVNAGQLMGEAGKRNWRGWLLGRAAYDFWIKRLREGFFCVGCDEKEWNCLAPLALSVAGNRSSAARFMELTASDLGLRGDGKMKSIISDLIAISRTLKAYGNKKKAARTLKKERETVKLIANLEEIRDREAKIADRLSGMK